MVKRAHRFARLLCSSMATVVVVATTAGPASAAGVSVSPAQGLDPAGQIVVVRGSGFRPGIALFVMECRASSAEDHTCNSVGLQKVTTDGSGSFATRLSVVGRFGATDCLQVACGIKTSAVSGHADDRSQDTSTAISFRAAPPATSPPATAPPATVPPASAPPASAPVATPPPTTAPPTTAPTTAAPESSTTTTADGVTSTTAASSTTTDAPSAADDGREPADEAAATTAASVDEPDGSGGSGAPVAVGAVVAAALVAGGLLLRRRSTPDPVA